jgi:hypothetical protein
MITSAVDPMIGTSCEFLGSAVAYDQQRYHAESRHPCRTYEPQREGSDVARVQIGVAAPDRGELGREH